MKIPPSVADPFEKSSRNPRRTSGKALRLLSNFRCTAHLRLARDLDLIVREMHFYRRCNYPYFDIVCSCGPPQPGSTDAQTAAAFHKFKDDPIWLPKLN